MRLISIIVVVVVLVLWYLSAFYIAAPHEIHNMILGGFGMTHQQHQFLGVIIFMISLVIITIWAISSKDTAEVETSAQVSKPSQTPA